MFIKLLSSFKKQQLRQNNKRNVKHLVFYHIPKTGGSSVWHALAASAALQQIDIIDLYHESIVKFFDSSKTIEAISDRQKLLRKHTCLIHHHMEIKIQNYFDSPPLYATIVRDPFDRFLSHLNFFMKKRRSPGSEKEVLLDPVEMLKVIDDPSIDYNSLIDICSRSDYYQNYFRNWFGKLLLGRNGLGGDEDIKDVYDPRFPAYVRTAFKKISCFTDLNKAFSEIATSFGFSHKNVTLGHLLKSSKDQAFENVHFKYASRFEKDYSFLEEIGFRYKKLC
jgi:hypothetical protein